MSKAKATVSEEKRAKPAKAEHKPKTAKPKPKPTAPETVDALSDKSGLASLSVCCEDGLPVEPCDIYRIDDKGKLVCVLGSYKPDQVRDACFEIKTEEHLRALAKCARALFAKFPRNAEAIADALMIATDPHLDDEEMEELAYSVIEPLDRFDEVPRNQDYVSDFHLKSNVNGFYTVLDQFVENPSLENRCAFALLCEDLAKAVCRFQAQYSEELANPRSIE